jgi:VWFA-related protein
MLLVALLAVVALGQQQGEAIKVDVDLVNMYLTVCNSKGRLITNLERKSFSVFEDGRQQLITHFSRETDVPLTIVLLIDTSGSVHDKWRFERDAVADFLPKLLRTGHDKAAIATFNHDVELQHGYTDNPSVLVSALTRIQPGGGTRMYDALQSVLQQYLNGPEERKTIILLSDGDDRFSRRSLNDIVHLAYRSNVSIYAISTNSIGRRPNEADRSDQALLSLADQTGGLALFPKSAVKLDSHFEKLAKELRSQYTIGYRSTNEEQNGTFRAIHIETNNSHYVVRTRAGYFAPLRSVADRQD